jgi:hypothetical protein
MKYTAIRISIVAAILWSASPAFSETIQVDFGAVGFTTGTGNGTTTEGGTTWNGVEPGNSGANLTPGSSSTYSALLDSTGTATGVDLTLDWSDQAGLDFSRAWDLHPGDRDGDYIGIRGDNPGVFNVVTFSNLTPGAIYDVTVWTQSETDFRVNGGPVEVVAGVQNTSEVNAAASHIFEDVVVGAEGTIVIDWGHITTDRGANAWSTTTAMSITRFVDTDSDNLDDDWELSFAPAVSGLADLNGLLPAGSGPGAGTGDFDGDGLSDSDEFDKGTNPTLADSDADGIDDLDEINGTRNPWAGGTFGLPPGDATDPRDADSDDDGILDGEEVVEGTDTFVTDPNAADTDGDTLPDSFEVDGGLDPTDDGSGDSDNGESGDPDNDGLDNSQELALGTAPNDDDTDNDGYKDGVEDNFHSWDGVDATGTDPLNPDSDGDRILDGNENPDGGTPGGPVYGTDPNEADTDFDGWIDGDEIEGGSDPLDINDVPSVTIFTVGPLVNGDFEQNDLPAGEHDEVAGWTRGNLAGTVEIDDGAGGLDNGSWNNTRGAASQVGAISVNAGVKQSWIYQTVTGTSSVNSANHDLTTMEAEGATFSLSIRIGIQAFSEWQDAHAIILFALQERKPWVTLDQVRVYTGTLAQAEAAGVATADVYLGLDDTDPNGASTVFTHDFTVTGGSTATAKPLIFAANIYRSQVADQARGVFDDMSLALGTTAAPLIVTDARFNGAAFELTVTGFDTAKTYLLKRSGDLQDGFPDTVGAPFTPASATDTVSDPTPPAGRAFYKVEEAP